MTLLVGKDVVYRPDLVTLMRGEPRLARVVGQSVDGLRLRVQYPDGHEQVVESRFCTVKDAG